jgi:hypothetical protein
MIKMPFAACFTLIIWMFAPVKGSKASPRDLEESLAVLLQKDCPFFFLNWTEASLI